jgi:hypothetical protein
MAFFDKHSLMSGMSEMTSIAEKIGRSLEQEYEVGTQSECSRKHPGHLGQPLATGEEAVESPVSSASPGDGSALHDSRGTQRFLGRWRRGLCPPWPSVPPPKRGFAAGPRPCSQPNCASRSLGGA